MDKQQQTKATHQKHIKTTTKTKTKKNKHKNRSDKTHIQKP